MDLVSIIMPVYNGEKYIIETIESVVKQTYSEWELIIVDDGSTDESENLIRKYLSDKIIFINRPSKRVKGGNTCRNIGIERAKGTYCIFLDADDLLAPNCIKHRVAYMTEYKHLDFAVFNTNKFIDNIENSTIHTRLCTDNPLPHFLGLNCLWQTTSPIWKTSFVKKIMFNENFQRLQDPEMVIRALNYPAVRFELIQNSIPDSYYRIVKKGNKDTRKRNISINYSNSFKQFIDEFCPLFLCKSSYENSKKSLFYVLTQHHISVIDDSNIEKYIENVKKINPKLNGIDILVYSLCKRHFGLRFLGNKVIRKICIMYFYHSLHKIWGNLFICY